jgi:hypothetical protein
MLILDSNDVLKALPDNKRGFIHKIILYDGIKPPKFGEDHCRVGTLPSRTAVMEICEFELHDRGLAASWCEESRDGQTVGLVILGLRENHTNSAYSTSLKVIKKRFFTA